MRGREQGALGEHHAVSFKIGTAAADYARRYRDNVRRRNRHLFTPWEEISRRRLRCRH